MRVLPLSDLEIGLHLPLLLSKLRKRVEIYCVDLVCVLNVPFSGFDFLSVFKLLLFFYFIFFFFHFTFISLHKVLVHGA